MKTIALFLSMFLTSASYAMPITLGDITGNALHVETDTLDEQFALTDTSGVVDDATAFLLFEYAGFASVNTFGIYGGGESLEIFNGSDSSITSATLSWNIVTDTVTNLTSSAMAVIDDQLFGFYLESGDGNTYYSEAALNGGLDMLMTFDVGSAGHADLFGSNYILAWEDVAGYKRRTGK